MTLRDDLQLKLAKPRGGLVLDLPERCWTDRFIQEIKWDGIRESCEIAKGRTYLQGRNKHGKTKGAAHSSGQSFVDQSDRAPHIRDLDLPRQYRGTLLDGELVWGDDSSLALSVEGRGRQTYHVFDCLFFRGEDVRSYPLVERRKLLKEVVKVAGSTAMRVGRALKATKKNYELAMARGLEGTVFKRKDGLYGASTYADGWWRAKSAVTHDAVIMDVSQATRGGSPKRGIKPKPVPAVATITVGMYSVEGDLVEVGKARFNLGIRDLAESMWSTWPSDKGRVIEMRASGFNEKRFRWCEMLRFRDDKPAGECLVPVGATKVGCNQLH